MQEVWLAGRSAPIRADAVVLALGHLDMAAANDHADHAAFADAPRAVPPPARLLGRRRPLGRARRRRRHRPRLRAGVHRRHGAADRGTRRPVRARTVGAAALRAVRIGAAPVRRLASRRAVPRQDRLPAAAADPPPLPRFLDAAAVDALIGGPWPVDFFADVWPLLAKDDRLGLLPRALPRPPRPHRYARGTTSPPGTAELDWGGARAGPRW